MEAMVGEEEMAEKYECSGVSQSCPYIPECLVFNILLRLPVKSVGRFRCVSTHWLSISTDPFFIAAHNRRTPKYLICPLIRMLHKNELFNASITGFDRRGGANVPLSSCDGLVCFISDFSSKVPCTNYVLNTLTGLRIDFPSPSANMYGKYSSMRELYYHRWTGQYRILSVNGKHAEVLSLGGAMDSWRRINSELPSTQVLPSWRWCFLVNDCLYWICSAVESIIVFDVLEEAFSCMALPHDVGGPNYGLIDIDGKLGCWMASQNAIDSSYQINIWVKVEGGDKWGSSSAYSLHLGVVESRRLIHPYTPDATIPFVFFSKGDIFLLLNGLDMLYLLRWDLNSGIYSTQELSYEHITGLDRVLIHKETLMDLATITQHV